MRIGHVIRAERVRQEMKQVVLAKGICTPSYLSKIERNLIEPSEEVVELLMERLGMDPGKFTQPAQDKTEQEFLKMLKDSYRNVITKRDKDYTRQQLDMLLQENPIFEDQSIYYTYLLIVLRFRLILGEDLEGCRREIYALENIFPQFNEYQQHLFTLVKALYYYSIGNLRKAINYFQDAAKIMESLILDEWEKNEFYYMIGVAYTADIRIFYSFEYVKKALEYFRENLYMKRVLDCYILLGITYKKTDQYDEALEAYHKASQICEEFHFDNEKGLIYHNLGSLNSVMGNSKDAIYFYEKSLEYKIGIANPLITVYCLVIEFYKSSNKDLVEKWTKEGLQLYETLSDEKLKPYYYHLSFHHSLNKKEGLDIELAKETIEYFKSIDDYKNIQKYCIALAEWFYSNRKYKLSSIYFREANRYGHYKKIDNWEDLN
ncbi:transcriptional regulator [Sporosarcina sp. NCCP-2222]|uniref:tetratricopeptide repeat protein n=1 Tax=Sporosarcina sp. NCCP-2222 TaxID=2935073 RepID=UPI0020849585|nr:tetratricopeptide repeat protein [Sporosarcina sp. NCCP-2222]GKV56855.1 transcriptional regulator [Sporosarcina sp. NCCP-2222]